MSLPEWPPNPRPPRAGADLADAIARRIDVSWEESAHVLGIILLCLRDAMSQGQAVDLHGFGTLRPCQRPPHPHVVITFRAHKHLGARLQPLQAAS